MASLDTNILLRLVLNNEPVLVNRVRKLLARHDVFAVSDVVIIEMEYILCGYYQYSRKQFGDIITELFVNNQHINMNRQLFMYVLPYYQKHSGVSFTDCCLAGYAKLNNQTPLYTFDKKLVRDLPHVKEA